MRQFANALTYLGLILFSMSASAHDGDNPGAVIGDNGWKSFELITENDSLAGLVLGQSYTPGNVSPSGTFFWNSDIHNRWDGLGAFATGADNLRVLVNHEGTDDATINAIDINIANLQTWALDFPTETPWPGPGNVVTGIGTGFTSVDTATGGSGRNLSNVPLSRFCSGNVWEADTFGTGRGFADQLFLTGEEDLTTTNAGGSIWVLDTTNDVLYEAPDVGPLGGRWENACPLDTGNTDQVAVLLSSDGGTNQLYLYVGTKSESPTANFLARNGLVGGQIYQFDPNGSTTQFPSSGSLSGTFAINTNQPLVEDKLEDVHVNPNNPMQAVVADQTDGIYEISFVFQFDGNGTLNTATSSFTASLLNSISSSDDLDSPDNLDWSSDGFIYVNEDGGGHDAWQLDPDSGEVTRIANGITTETSGIKDISSLVGFESGSIFLTNSYNGSNANGNNGALYMLVSPSAQKTPDVLLGDVNLDGVVNLLDVESFVDRVTSGTFQVEADVNQDGSVNLLDVGPFVEILSGG